MNAEVSNLVGRSRSGRETHVTGIEFLVIFREFMGQYDLPRETDGCSPLRIVNIDVLPVIRTKIYGNCLMDRSFPVYDYLVIRVVEYNFVSSIVVCVIRVIGF